MFYDFPFAFASKTFYFHLLRNFWNNKGVDNSSEQKTPFIKLCTSSTLKNLLNKKTYIFHFLKYFLRLSRTKLFWKAHVSIIVRSMGELKT